MPRYELLRDPNGDYHRLTVEHRLGSLEPLLALQQQYAQDCRWLTPTTLGEHHVTLIHLGKPRELYAQIQVINPGLSFDEFLIQLQEALEQISQLREEPYLAIHSGLDIFTHRHAHYLVATMQLDARLQARRRQLVRIVRRFLLRCGVHHIDEFVRRNPNLEFLPNDRYQPDVTLGTIALPALASDAQISLGPQILRGTRI